MRQIRPLFANLSKAVRFTLASALSLAILLTLAPGIHAGYSIFGSVSEFFGWQDVRETAASGAPKSLYSRDPRANIFLLTAGPAPYSLAVPPFNTLDVAISENFNGMGSSGTAALPTDWRFGSSTAYSSGVTAATLAAGTSGTGTLTGTSSGGYYNLANGVTASATDRAPGWLTTTTFTGPRQLFVRLTNNTGATIGSADIAYDIEKYRNGTRAVNITFFTSTDGTTWTAQTAGDQAYAVNGGNTVVNPPTTIGKSFTVNGFSIPNGSDLYLRWSYAGVGGSSNAQALGIDNFSFTPHQAVPGTIEFSSAAFTELEGNTATITVNRVNGNLGAVSVDHTTGGGSATGDAACTAGVDYVTSSGTLNWADGDNAAKSFNVQLCTDGAVDTEDLDLTLSNPVGTTITGTNPAALDITDNPSGSLQLNATSSSADENLPNWLILASRTGGSGGAVSIDFAVTGGTATNGASCAAGVDYVLPANGTLNWASLDATNKPITLQLCPDLVSYEGPETVIIEISNVQGGAGLGSPTTHAVTINDMPASFSNPASIGIPNVGPSTLYPSDITVAGVPGSLSNLSVTLSSVTHTFPDDIFVLLVGPGGQTFVLQGLAGGGGNITNRTYTFSDSAANLLADETGNPSGIYKPTNYFPTAGWPSPAPGAPYAQPGPSGTDTLNGIFGGIDPNGTWSLYVNDFADPDGGAINGGWSLQIHTTVPTPGTVEFSSAAFNGSEGGTAAINVNRVGGTLGAVSVDYAMTGGTATGGAACGAGVDFVNTSGTLNWADGDGAQKSFNVQTCPDAELAEITETASLTLSNPVGTSITGTNPATLNIENNSFGGSLFSNHNPITIPSSGPGTPYPSTITVSGVTGTISNMRLTLNNLSHTYTGDIMMLLVGPQGQKFVPMGNAGSNSQSNNVTLKLWDGAADLIPTAPLANGEYKPTSYFDSGDFTFPAPTGPYSKPAPVGGDTFMSTFGGTDPNGTWSLYVADLSDPDVGSIADGWDLEIVGSTPVPGTVEFSSAAYNGPEGGTATITAKRVGGSLGAIAVDYATGGGTAAGGAACGAGVDFVNASGTFNWADGDSADKSFTVPLCADALTSETSETVNLTLSNPVGTSITGTNPAVLNIENNSFDGTIFSNNAPIGIPVLGPATPYPSTIEVTGMTGAITEVRVVLKNFSHTYTSDTHILLVGPGGQKFVLMSDVGSNTAASDVTLSLYDSAAANLTAAALMSGSFKPTDMPGAPDSWPAPAPSAPFNSPAPWGGATFGSVFTGADPNGTWSLYVFDSISPDGGSIAGGWELQIAAAETVRFNPGNYTPVENAGTVQLQVVRPSNTTAATVDYTLPSAGALYPAVGAASCGAGVDYINTPGTLIFGIGDLTKNIDITLCDDAVFDGLKIILPELSNPTGGLVLGSPSVATVSINDDETPPTLSISDVTVNENAGTASFQVTQSFATTTLTQFLYSTSDGSALAGFDYTGSTNAAGQITAGNTTTTIVVPILGDSGFEETETFTVSFTNIVNADPGDPTGVGTITDDDAAASYVVTTTNNVNDGTCDATHCSLHEAINASNAAPGTLTFAPGVTGTITFSGSRPSITNNVVINGPGADALAVSGNDIVTVFDIVGASTAVTIRGLTVRNGRNLDFGQGGAITNAGMLTVENSVITTNRGFFAGAIQTYGPLNVRSSTISDNVGGSGGGDPGCSSIAGAIDSSNDVTINITNSTISGNSVATNCSANSGAINLFAGRVVVTGSTITNNTSSDNSSAIGGGTASTSIIRNSIIAGNLGNSSAPDVEGLYESQGYNLIGNPGLVTVFTQVGDQAGSSGTPLDPMLGALANNGGTTSTHKPQPGSTAIDHGFSFGLTTDQRGALRPIEITTVPNSPSGDGSDIGAFEVSNPVITTIGGPLTFPATPVGTASAIESYSIIGTGLENGITVTAPAGFEVSLSAFSTFGPSVTLPATSGFVTLVDVFVRFAPTSPGPAAGNVANTSPNAVTKNIAVSGNGLANNGSLQFSGAAYSDNETNADHTVVIHVTRTSSSTGAISVDYGVTDGTATIADNDYSVVSATGTLSWADGDIADKTFTITVKGDMTVEPDETIDLALSNPTGGAFIGSQASAVLTITNDDLPPGAYVVNSNDDTNDGNCDASHCSLREAINAVNAHYGEITFAPNVTGEINLLSALPMITSPSATVTGPGAAALTIRPDASVPNNRMFTQNGNLTVSGLRFYAGIGNGGSGGAIVNNGASSLTISDCVFEANSAGFNGGAISHSSSGELTISNSTFLSNTTSGSGTGGAISIAFDPTVTITNTTFSGSSAGTGGTISAESGNITFTGSTINGSNAAFQGAGFYYGGTGTLNITDSRISSAYAGNAGGAIQNQSTGTVNINRSTLNGNSATSNGGAVINFTGTVNITNSTISGNTSSSGGGLYNNGTGTINITNSTISGNSSGTGGGGGMYIWNGNGVGHIAITGSTITANHSNGVGGGIVNDTNNDVTLKNTIIAGNTVGTFAPDIYGAAVSNGYNLLGNNQLATFTSSTGDQIGTPSAVINAMLEPLANNGGTTSTHKLQTGSPAIDAGNAFTLTTDQRGLTRPADRINIANVSDGADIGAFEAQVPPTPTISVDDTVFGGDTLAPGSFTVSLSNESDLPVTVHYSTADDTAIAGQDYTATSGTLTFNPGETVQTVSVGVLPNTVNEATEQFFLNLDSPTNATMADGQGIGTINDDDPQATVAINDVTQVEGDSGTITYTFTVAKTGNTAQTVSVDYATANGVAASPGDFTATSGTLTFTSAETSKDITVTVNGDTDFEANETFFVRLTNPAAVNIIDGEGIGSIQNDDDPTTHIVNVTDDLNDGICDANHCSLREAIHFANGTGGWVTFAPGLTGTINLFTPLPAITHPNAVEIRGPGASVLTVRRDPGAFPMRIFDINGSGVYTINGLAINDGDVRPIGGAFNNLGGGIRILQSRGVTIESCTFTNNWANNGAAIYNGTNTSNGPLTVNNSTFTANNANQSGGGIENRFSNQLTVNSSTFNANGANTFGGGIHNIASGVVFVNDSTFTGNVANAGGAINNDDTGSLTISRTAISGNQAAVGGGIYNKNGGLDVFNSTISGNNASEGAGAYNHIATMNFYNSTVSGNTATSIGGGIYYTFQGPSHGTIQNCTITGNQGPNGGGVMVFNGSSVVRMGNTILAANTGSQGPDLYGTIYSNGYNILGTLGGSWGHMDPATGDQIGQFSIINPMLGPLADNGGPTKTRLPLAGSPAIDAGSAFGETADQRGFARTVNGVTDIGAVEIQNAPANIVVFSGSPQSATLGTNYALLQARVTDAGNAPVGGVTVTFTAPASGPSVSFPGNLNTVTAVTDGNGVATSPVPTAITATGSFDVTASYPSSAVVNFSLTNLAQPTLSVNDVTFTGADSFVPNSFTVTLSAASTSPVTVHYQTADDTAIAGQDYTAVNDTLTFAPGETEKNISITILPDTVQEGTEQFFLNLDSPVGATIADNQGIGTIPNDDAGPTFAIDDVTMNEGNSGTTNFVFTITKTGSTTLSSTVNYQTNAGTATDGTDYTGINSLVTFLPNETTKQISVLVNGDIVYEDNQTFNVNLTGTNNGSFTDAQGLGTITNDDAAPVFTIEDASGNEGNGGITPLNIILRKTGPSEVPATVTFTTVNGTADSTTDYYEFNTTVPIPADSEVIPMALSLRGDTVHENTETFTLNLSNATGATIGDGSATMTIMDDDAAPTIGINDYAINEGPGGGTTSFTFNVFKITNNTAVSGTVDYVVQDGTATAGDNDFVVATGSVTFLPAETSKPITVTVNGDYKVEPDETFTVHLQNPSNLTISDSDGLGTITNDDVAPPVTYVDDDWASVAIGTDPDGAGLATAFGYDAFSTVQNGIDGVAAGGTVNVYAGMYKENPNVNKAVNLIGANSGIAGEGVRNAESTIGASGNTSNVITINANNIVIDGFTIDGDDPSVTGLPIYSGDDTNASYAFRSGSQNHLQVKNNIVKRVSIGFRADGDSKDNSLANNWFDSIGSFDFGYAVTLRNNYYADVTGNKMTRVWTGVHLNNFSFAGGPALMNVSGNNVKAYAAGLFSTLRYNAASPLAVSSNQFAPEAGAVDNNVGILLASTQDAVIATFTGNTIVNTHYGIILTTVSTGNVIDFGATNSVTGAVKAGVYVTDNLTFNPVSTANLALPATTVPMSVKLSGISIAGSGNTGVKIENTRAPGTEIANNVEITGANIGFFSKGLEVVGPMTNVTMTGSTIAASGTGIAVQNSGATPVSLTAHYNRIVADTYAIENGSNQPLALENNWWGCNAGPGNTGCGASTGTGQDFDPWIVLGISASPNPIGSGSSSTVTADMTHNSAGAVPSATEFIPQVGASFGATEGNVAPPTGTITSGTAATTFTSNSVNPATASATVDNQTVSTNISVIPPSFTINDVTTAEGNSGTTAFTFTVTKTGATGFSSTVNYATQNGTAQAGSDFTGISSTPLSFGPSETSKEVTVLVNGDTTFETSENFGVVLTDPVNATLGDDFGSGTITNDDAQPSFSVDSVSHSEGDSGTTSYTFTVTQTGATDVFSTVDYQAQSNTADIFDFAAASGTLNFDPGETVKQFTVLVNGDQVYENDEVFNVVLSNPLNAGISAGTGTGTILNDDAAPTIAIDDVTMTEGDSGTKTFTFTITKTGQTAFNGGVDYVVQDGTATVADGDFAAGSGNIPFLIADTSKTVSVTINGDATYENNETFVVHLQNEAGLVVSRRDGTGTITNDDAQPTISIDDYTFTGADSVVVSGFTVTLTGATDVQATVNYQTADGTAIAGEDYTATSGTLTFAPGETSKNIPVAILPDTTQEATEQFVVNLDTPVGATISDVQGVGTIPNDDAAPSFSIDNVTLNEGNAGTTSFTFTVTKTGATALASSVQFETQDGSATLADNDYQSNTGTLNFLAADTSKQVTVLVNGNFFIEPDEEFIVHLSGATNATISDADGTGTITNDDFTPLVTYVDDDWAALTNGTDPDGAGPANAIGYDAFDTIQEGINAVAASGTVNVHAGTYDEDVSANNPGVSIIGAGAGSTNIRGPIGGPGMTVQIAASNVTLAGFTITRLGNNTTEWNDPNLNNVAIAIQGQSIAGTLVRDNVITGNRTGIDINNSNGHTVRNNVIDFNRIGIIFRNQTDSMNVTENFITNSWAVGIVFLDASGGTNSPQQSALNSTFSNNDISGNWYGQIVDRQSGGSLPAPGTTNLKNFKGNWYGTNMPVVTSANSAEPGYAAMIPVAYGGAAVPPGGQPDIAGPASANFQYEAQLLSGVDTNVETTPGRGTFGFQGVANVPILDVQDHTFTGMDSLGASQGFTVTLTGETNEVVTVHYQTSDDTAVAGQDYDTASGTLTFNPGETSKVIPINILPDTVQETTEQFSITLDTPVNAGILDGNATGTIPNDDAAPTFSIDNVTQAEGVGGFTTFVFFVTKTGSTALPSSIDYTTQAGTATAGAVCGSGIDYETRSGTLNFAAGDTSQMVLVNVCGDTVVEGDETFTIQLSNAVNGSITGDGGLGTIQNNTTPAVQFESAAYMDDESQTAVVTLMRTGDTAGASTVTFSTSNGTATGGSCSTLGVDYESVSTSVTFDPTETIKTVNVPLCMDPLFETTFETINLTLTSGATVIGDRGTAVLSVNDTAAQHKSSAPIIIGDNGNANPYPTTINVTGAPSVTGTMRVTLFDLTHANPEDLEILLVAPNGTSMVLVADTGGANALTGNGATITFDDAAGAVLPDSGQIVTGKYEPTSWGPVMPFTPPAPAGPYATPNSSVGGSINLNSVFGAGPPNGIWQLFIRDGSGGPPPLGAGQIAAGWGLQFLAPTSAEATISGRVTTASGNGIRNAIVRITGGNLTEPRTVATGSLGMYQFDGLPTGTTYVIQVSAKRFRFAQPSMVLTLQDAANVDFVANPQE